MKKIAVVICLVILGCMNPGIVQLSPDTYMLSRIDKGGVFGNPSAMKAAVIDEVNKFAKSQGKVAIPISTSEVPMQIGRFASFDYQFRLVDPASPEARSTALLPRPDVVVEQSSKSTVDIKTKDETSKSKDIYSELIKLDDLRKRGILTEDEFEAQKKKLLSGN